MGTAKNILQSIMDSGFGKSLLHSSQLEKRYRNVTGADELHARVHPQSNNSKEKIRVLWNADDGSHTENVELNVKAALQREKFQENTC